METEIFTMKIIDERDGEYILKIEDGKIFTLIAFHTESRSLKFLTNNHISSFLKRNEYQFRKILHIKREETFYIGFSLKFVLRDKKDVHAFNDKSNIIVLDKRSGRYLCYVLSDSSAEKGIYSLYTDGSFLIEKQKGAIAVLTRSPDGISRTYAEKTTGKNSNLIELLAVIKGLELLEKHEKIRIVTDSQYVRKGMTEWIINWKLNDWYTANGEKAKHIDHWKRCDLLTDGKYIEFEWVKSHSVHFENNLCDRFARAAAQD